MQFINSTNLQNVSTTCKSIAPLTFIQVVTPSPLLLPTHSLTELQVSLKPRAIGKSDIIITAVGILHFFHACRLCVLKSNFLSPLLMVYSTESHGIKVYDQEAITRIQNSRSGNFAPANSLKSPMGEFWKCKIKYKLLLTFSVVNLHIELKLKYMQETVTSLA